MITLKKKNYNYIYNIILYLFDQAIMIDELIKILEKFNKYAVQINRSFDNLLSGIITNIDLIHNYISIIQYLY